MITLPKVDEFDFHSKGHDGLNAKTLIIWLLLAPNVVQIDLTQLNQNDSIALIDEINQLYETDERVRPIFGRIVRVYSLPLQYQVNASTEQYLFQTLRKIFAEISISFPWNKN